MPQSVNTKSRAMMSIDMTAFADERIVTAVSGLVSEFCKVVIEDADTASRFQIAAHELAENAVRYSTGSVSIEVELEHREDKADEPAILKVRTTNETTPERLTEVQRRLRELTAAEDPICLYDQMICEAAPRASGSGLGLVRIRAESEMQFKSWIDGRTVSICVFAPVMPRRRHHHGS